jgi:hypothetical protein
MRSIGLVSLSKTVFTTRRRANLGGSIDGVVDSMAAAFGGSIAVETTDSNELIFRLAGFETEPGRVTDTLRE